VHQRQRLAYLLVHVDGVQGLYQYVGDLVGGYRGLAPEVRERALPGDGEG